jgi:ubiquinone/menaquinone biosynthesis C-methylase UbiE
VGAQALPCADTTFDDVVCQFGVMFYPDRLAGYREARRVLIPGGRFLFSGGDRLECAAVPRALSQRLPRQEPWHFERVAFGYRDVATIWRSLGTASWRNCHIETVSLTGAAITAWDAAISLCQATPIRR